MLTMPIKIALLGCGRMGRNHLRLLMDDPRFEVVAVLDPAGAPVFAPVLSPLTMVEELDGIRFDAAIVATPTPTHAGLAARLLGRRVKVLVEKPLAPSYATCRAFVAAPTPALAVGHVERFNPAVRALAEVLARGGIGEPIHFVSTRIGGYPAAASPESNVALDLAVHDLDVLRHLIGPLRVEASACHATTDPNVCDTAEILLSSQHGASATVHVDWIAPTKIRTLRVTGTRGAAFVDYIAQTCAVVRGSARVEVPVERREPLRAQLDAFHDFVTTGARGLLCSGEDAAAAVLLAERALAASRGAWV
jgi:UDP-N-acetylglucosamine 3-dehydrogenase